VALTEQLHQQEAQSTKDSDSHNTTETETSSTTYPSSVETSPPQNTKTPICQNDSNTYPKEHPTKHPINKENSNKHKKPRVNSLLTIVKTLKANVSRKPYAVAVTERLPHMLFPVGPGDQTRWKHLPTIRGVFDTGSGITIGYLPYWSSVAERYPQLIEQFGEMDNTTYEELKVAGIQRDGEGSLCTHFIVLITPFVDNGEPVTIRIALTNELSCNLIFGLPFIIKAKMAVHLWDKYVSSAVFRTTFPLEFHAPEIREEVPMQDNTSTTFKTLPTQEDPSQ
jgi:hypothetical protein